MSAEVLKFGKYAGQPLEVLVNDPEYMEWLLNQAWFKAKHPTQYNIIINNFSVPSDTPEHNRLQAKFLNRKLLEQLARTVFEYPEHSSITVRRPRFETEGWDVFVRIRVAEFCWMNKVKNKSWTDNAYDLKDKDGFQWGEDAGQVDRLYPSLKKYRMFSAPNCDHYDGLSFGIELKPSMGDDFPTVLRQVKRHGNCNVAIVLVDEFCATSVTFDEVSEMFMGDGIRVIRLSEIEVPMTLTVLPPNLLQVV